jgi:nucleoside phosphorylase
MNAERGVRSAETRPFGNLVCFALEEEARAFRRLVKGRADVFILVTGIGRSNAEGSIIAALQMRYPRVVLTCGFAGALNPGLSSGEIVFAASESAVRERLIALGARQAKFHCPPRIATTAAEKRELYRITGADAVEMESEVIQSLCRAKEIPCATVRVISDAANEDLPLDFNQLSKADASLDFGKLALAIAKSPGKISSLLRLQKNCRHAAAGLAEVLGQVIGPPQAP